MCAVIFERVRPSQLSLAAAAYCSFSSSLEQEREREREREFEFLNPFITKFKTLSSQLTPCLLFFKKTKQNYSTDKTKLS